MNFVHSLLKGEFDFIIPLSYISFSTGIAVFIFSASVLSRHIKARSRCIKSKRFNDTDEDLARERYENVL